MVSVFQVECDVLGICYQAEATKARALEKMWSSSPESTLLIWDKYIDITKICVHVREYLTSESN